MNISVVDCAQWDGFEWQTRMTLTGVQFKTASPLDTMFDNFPPNPLMLAARTELSIIINELWVNALDHGLLGLDSALKEGEDGMLNYYREREVALAQMNSGTITFSLHCKIVGGIAEFTLACEDSGTGFNLDEVLTRSKNDSRYSGRGLRMVAALCDEITSNACGNIISLRYRWPAQPARELR